MVREGLLLIGLTVVRLSGAGTGPDLEFVVWTAGMLGGVAVVIAGIATGLRRS
jgi:hypothetical protein